MSSNIVYLGLFRMINQLWIFYDAFLQPLLRALYVLASFSIRSGKTKKIIPDVSSTVDPLLSSVLTCEIDPTSSRDVTRWLGFIVTTLPILTHQSPEEAILRRLVELGIR